MSSFRLVAAAGSCLLVACTPDLKLPEQAMVTCSASAPVCPDGRLCFNGRCVRAEGADTTPPDLASAPAVTPAVGRPGTQFTINLVVTEPLLIPPSVRIAFAVPIESSCEPAQEPQRYRCAYLATGNEVDGAHTVASFDVHLVDRARNETDRRLAGALRLDVAPPAVTVSTAALLPALGNPLASPTMATVGTTVLVAVAADEPVDLSQPPTLTTDGELPLLFALDAEGSTATSLLFRSQVPPGVADRSFSMRVSWRDAVGNAGEASVPGSIAVKSSPPVLTVLQEQVTYLRSPWGQTSVEIRGGGRVLAGPLFELGPADPLAQAQALPGSTFQLDTGAPAAIRVWGDDAKGSLLGSTALSSDGSWPRLRLESRDSVAAWVTGVDAAGNESEPIKVLSAEWVATANPSPAGATPHQTWATGYDTGTLALDPQAALAAPGELAGMDGSMAVARARGAMRRLGAGVSPPALTGAAMAFDAARGRVVLFGGSDATNASRNETWEWDGRSWANRSVVGPCPTPRVDSAMAYDAARGRMLLYGGYDGSFPADTWEWDGAAWKRLSPPENPGGRRDHALAYDALRRVVVLFGGGDYSSNATWEWDGVTWRRSGYTYDSSTVPANRTSAALAFDAARGRMVLFGGSRSSDSALLADLYEWQETGWQQVPYSGGPGGRAEPAFFYDPDGARLLLHGGGGSGGVRCSDTWAWDGSAWTSVPTSAAPSSRQSEGFAFDPIRQRLLTFGGWGMGGPVADLWELALGTTNDWSKRTSGSGLAPPPREAAAFVFDPVRKRAVLFGGRDSSFQPYSDTWEWDGGAWMDRTPAVMPAALAGGRIAPGATYDPDRGRVVIFGGRTSGSAETADLWEWDGTNWTPRALAAASPPARERPGLVYDTTNRQLVLYGGASQGNYPYVPRDDVWTLPFTSGSTPATWSERGPSPAGKRHAHLAFFDAGRCFFLMGEVGTLSGASWSLDQARDLWAYDAGPANSWTGDLAASLASKPSSFAAGLAWDSVRRRAVLFGGNANGASDELWEWNQDSWIQVAKTDLEQRPAPRSSPSLTFDPGRGRTLVFGGYASGLTNDLWEYDVVPGADQRAEPSVGLRVHYETGGFTPAQVTGLRVRARAGGHFGAAGAGAQLSGWSGAGDAPGSWRPVAANAVELPLGDPPLGLIDWSAGPGEASRYLLEREQTIAFALKPAGVATGADPDPSVAVDYLEVRVRYSP